MKSNPLSPGRRAGLWHRLPQRRLVQARFALALLAALLLIAGVAAAAAPETISRHVMAGGGQQVKGGAHFILDGTLAEPVAGPLVLQGDRQIGSGYWQEPQAIHDAFLPLIRR